MDACEPSPAEEKALADRQVRLSKHELEEKDRINWREGGWKMHNGRMFPHFHVDKVREELESTGILAFRLHCSILKVSFKLKYDLGSYGLPQLLVPLANGSVLWLYCSKNGGLTQPQILTKSKLENVGQRVACVCTLDEALDAIKAVS